MVLSLLQVAESFGVSESVVEGWVRDEGLPHVMDRGRLLFDRSRVARWAASRGLASRVGFLAPPSAVHPSRLRLDDLLRRGGIWRGLPLADLPSILAQLLSRLPGASPEVQQLLLERLGAPGGLSLAPVGGGFALPHPSARIALGRGSGLVALLMLSEALPVTEPVPDEAPVRWLLFFIAPSPRDHLDLLARLSRLLTSRSWRELVQGGASDTEILAGCAAAELETRAARREGAAP